MTSRIWDTAMEVKMVSKWSRGINSLHAVKMRERGKKEKKKKKFSAPVARLPPPRRLRSHFLHSLSGCDTHLPYSKITYCEQFQQEIRAVSALWLQNVCFSKEKKKWWLGVIKIQSCLSHVVVLTENETLRDSCNLNHKKKTELEMETGWTAVSVHSRRLSALTLGFLWVCCHWM